MADNPKETIPSIEDLLTWMRADTIYLQGCADVLDCKPIKAKVQNMQKNLKELKAILLDESPTRGTE